MSESKGVKFLKLLAEHGLAVTIGLAAIVRIYLLLIREYVIVNDGLLYVQWIEKIQELGMKGAFTKAYPFNLFPLFAACLQKISFGSLSAETSVLILNFFFGLLALVPVYLLAKRIFGKLPALVTGFYIAWHPIFTEVSCQVLREAPAICFALWAVYFLLTGLEKEEPENWDYKKLILSVVFILLSLLIRLEMLALFGVAFVTLLFAHYEKGRDNHFAKRFTILFICAAFLLVSAACLLCAVRVAKGQWDFARIDKIFSTQGMGEEKYDVADPLKPSAEIYDAQGQPIPMARTKYAFAHLAWDHQRALFGYEILYKTWKTLHPVGLALLVIALYYLVTKKPIKPTAPINVFSLVLVIVMGVIYYRYVSTKFAVSNRHILLPVFVLSVYMGLFTTYLRVEKGYQKLLLAFCLAAAFLMLTYKAFRPLESHRLPIKLYGKQLAAKKLIPEKSLLIEPDGLKQLAYYAGMRHKMWASQTSEELLEQLAKKENAFLLVNFRDDSHTAAFLPIKDKLEQIGSLEPIDKKFELKLYRLKE
jgi:hypothetical protein